MTRCALLANTPVMVLHTEVTMRTVRCLLALAVSAAALPAPADDCVVDRAALLALSPDQFDQDLAGGWRPMAEKPACQLPAADLIAAYRAQPKAAGNTTLIWHEAQLRAQAGQEAQAVALMRQTYRPAPDAGGWNPYVDASIALIENNKPALVAARAALAAVPAPPEAKVKDGFFSFTLPSGETMKVAWPPNLDVVDAFVRCFGQSYRDAIGMACRTPGR
ncbi:hypothetical protein ABIA71_001246 [Stenotrophomonas sp. 2619]|uniref:hypothetical protein n=1 Tax=Stenotrophomonas sp. 2619 TaxID=3156316 RepID=UPI0033985601